VAAKIEKGQIYRAVDPPHFEWRVEEVYPASNGPSNCKIVRTDDRHAVKTMSTVALADDTLFTPKPDGP